MPKANTIYSKNSTLQQPQQILYNANLCCTIPSDTIFQRCHPCSITWLKNRNCFIAFTFILAVLGEQANLEKITKCMLFPHKPVNTKKTKKTYSHFVQSHKEILQNLYFVYQNLLQCSFLGNLQYSIAQNLRLPNFACVNQVPFIGNYSSQSLFHVFRLKVQ